MKRWGPWPLPAKKGHDFSNFSYRQNSNFQFLTRFLGVVARVRLGELGVLRGPRQTALGAVKGSKWVEF